MKYLRTRAARQVVTPTYITATPKGKGGKGSVKRLKVCSRPTRLDVATGNDHWSHRAGTIPTKGQRQRQTPGW